MHVGTGTDTTRNGNLHVGFGAEMQRCRGGNVKEQNVTCREMNDERVESVGVMVVVLRS